MARLAKRLSTRNSVGSSTSSPTPARTPGNGGGAAAPPDTTDPSRRDRFKKLRTCVALRLRLRQQLQHSRDSGWRARLGDPGAVGCGRRPPARRGGRPGGPRGRLAERPCRVGAFCQDESVDPWASHRGPGGDHCRGPSAGYIGGSGMACTALGGEFGKNPGAGGHPVGSPPMSPPPKPAGLGGARAGSVSAAKGRNGFSFAHIAGCPAAPAARGPRGGFDRPAGPLMDRRPIVLMPVVCRLWAALRAKVMPDWLRGAGRAPRRPRHGGRRTSGALGPRAGCRPL